VTFTPANNPVEFHPTYRCDLSCVGCNRLCFLPPKTPDMTLDDARAFFRQANELDWHPTVAILGGEPTLYPYLFELIDLSAEFAPGRVQLWSNGYSQATKDIIARVRIDSKAEVIESTFKLHRNIVHSIRDMCLAPCDYGAAPREPCYAHCRDKCGVSVDAGGYTICPSGGAIDAFFGLGVRTKRLADLWDEGFAERQTRALCDRCGFMLGPKDVPGMELHYGIAMSSTWLKALDQNRDQNP
jgi:hypothetical protein